MGINTKEITAGLIFAGIGIFFTLSALLTLPIGEAFSMGPGYFPVVLGSVLTLLGIAICLTGARKAGEPMAPIAWRGLGLIMASIVFFGVTVRGLGFAPALFVSVALASLASEKLGWKAVLIVSVVLTAFCVAVFIYALGLPYPLIGRWITR
jgi:hypothetical protein